MLMNFFLSNNESNFLTNENLTSNQLYPVIFGEFDWNLVLQLMIGISISTNQVS